MSILRRAGFWFVSFLFAVTLFSLLIGNASGFFVIFRVTVIYAFPVWCLCLLFIFFLKDTDGRRSWILLLIGILIGPLVLTVWGLTHLLVGQNLFLGFWNGDPEEGMGTGFNMVFASVLGFLTTAFYVFFLKFVCSRPASKDV